jgi:uncharacterized protein (DUF58 family)
MTGGFIGKGIGNSVDFHDHRNYLPGDDPRYIDWLAYGRTGQYTLKLYREEVTPRVDLILDCSPSMFFDEQKGLRALEILYFALESSLLARAAIRCYLVSDQSSEVMLPENLLAYQIEQCPSNRQSSAPLDLRRIPLRQGSLRVLISDLLFPGSPATFLLELGAGRCQPLIFAPHCPNESDPDWSGNLDFIDSEDQSQRKQSVDAALLKRYREIYNRHFLLWKDECLRYQARISRVGSEGALAQALEVEALITRTVELWNC